MLVTLLEYTISKGYKIEGWEFGNELCGGGVAAKVNATQYAADMGNLKLVLVELFQYPSSLPKLSGPSGFFDREWFADFVQGIYPDWLDIVSHHIYNLGPGVDPNLEEKMQDPYVLDNAAQTYKDIQQTVQSFSPWSSVWVSESGGAYNNGGKASHTFVDGFCGHHWGISVHGYAGYDFYIRPPGFLPTIISWWKLWSPQYNNNGAKPRLLKVIDHFYNLVLLMYGDFTKVLLCMFVSALLFHRLMGRGVLATVHNGPPDLRAYSHCSKTKPGITLLMINLSNSTEFNIDVASDLNIYAPQDVALPSVGSVRMFGERSEHHLTPKDGDLNSTTVLLNGNPLEVTSSGEIPPMNPAVYNDSNPLTVAPSSIVFVVLSNFKAPACA
ncbi:heparanase-like protein 2 [Cinnamomum micranthum f. kanehirae]|uniref:Heparanase-like protein 2 n=1 Tax=Cinnamomum micranthum f. kanehirae TaxID=337451 RepID=A0A3S3MCG3_9MAGN|nr:heparanase-like protein 2 [Cinnamomum micranthum f. kanehirae]